VATTKKTVLHVGCGGFAPEKLHPVFREPGWREIRLDIDPGAAPDIVASITDMAPVADHSVDAVFSSHNLEHLYPHEVPAALAEFRRVLGADGFALVTMPDVQAIAECILARGLTETAYISGLGPITPMDMLYGFGPAMVQGNLFMAHRGGFTGASLLASLSGAGFGFSVVQRQPAAFCLWAIAFATQPGTRALEEAKARMLPLHMAAAHAQAQVGAAREPMLVD
jgi:SAM-dependent methyltransferase